LCIIHTFFEGKKAGEAYAKKPSWNVEVGSPTVS
jgi:hypothetical protein